MPFIQSTHWRNVDNTPNPSSFVSYLDQAAATLHDKRLEIADLLEVSPGCSVLDVGSGAGGFLIELATRVDGVRAIGIDTSHTMVTTATSRALAAGVAAQFSLGNAQQLPFRNGSFHRVNCSRVLVHVEDPRAAVAEIARVLLPGGRVTIFEPDIYAMVISSNDPDLATAVHRQLVEKLRNPDIGRRLRYLLLDNGLDQLELSQVTLGDINLLDHFNNIAKAGTVTDEEADQWREWIKAADNSHQVVVSPAAVQALATKPLR
jgi:SAM-dependent methyltransferase